MTAEFTDPVSGHTMTAKTVTTMVSDDKYTMDYYMVSPEGEFKSMEMVATRQ